MSTMRAVKVKVDAKKLKSLIETLAFETFGACTSTGVCIGVVDGKQIQIHVEADEDEFISQLSQYECVKQSK